MHILRARAGQDRAEPRTATFTGDVWAEPLGAAEGVRIASVVFTPRARTHWHRHTDGQVLYVTSGEGLLCERDGPPRLLLAGDTVWVPPGETHWHGAGPHGLLVHTAVTLGGTTWLEPVTDEEYDRPPHA